MKRIVGVGLAGLATSIMVTCPLVAGTGAQAAVLAAPCESTSSVGGHNALNFCGPATGTLVIGGTTYKFKNGSCSSIKVSDITVDVDLGTVVQGKDGGPVKGNAKKPWFSLDLSSSSADLLNDVYYGGKKLTNDAIVSVTGSVVKSGSSKGTFKTATSSLSGTWNCHGEFNKN